MSTITEQEIASQPEIWARALADDAPLDQVLGRRGESVLLLGCGTSAFVAESIARLREGAGHGSTRADYASEWAPTHPYDRVVLISRSGTTSEVLDALERVPAGTPTAAIVGVADSPLAQRVDHVLCLDYADESSVVQTRFPTTTLVLARKHLGDGLDGVVEQAEALLATPSAVDVAPYSHFVFLGRGWAYGLAQESALKIREAAQAWSESYPALDYRHGPIAVATPDTLVTLLGPYDAALADDVEKTGATVAWLDSDPLVQLVDCQRRAVSVAHARGLDPDNPRHLTRSVVFS